MCVYAQCLYDIKSSCCSLTAARWSNISAEWHFLPLHMEKYERCHWWHREAAGCLPFSESNIWRTYRDSIWTVWSWLGQEQNCSNQALICSERGRRSPQARAGYQISRCKDHIRYNIIPFICAQEWRNTVNVQYITRHKDRLVLRIGIYMVESTPDTALPNPGQYTLYMQGSGILAILLKYQQKTWMPKLISWEDLAELPSQL